MPSILYFNVLFHAPHVFHAQVKMTSQDVVVTISDSDLAAMEAEAPRCLCSALNGCQNRAICGSRSACTQRVLFHHRFCRSCFDQGFLVPMDSIWEIEPDSDLYRKRNVNRNGCNNHTNELLWETLTIGNHVVQARMCSRSIKSKTTKYVLFKNGFPTGLNSEDLQKLHPMYTVEIPTLNVKAWVRLLPRQHSMYPVADPSFTSTMEASLGASSQPPAEELVVAEHALSPTVQTTPHLLDTTAPSPYPGYHYAFSQHPHAVPSFPPSPPFTCSEPSAAPSSPSAPSASSKSAYSTASPRDDVYARRTRRVSTSENVDTLLQKARGFRPRAASAPDINIPTEQLFSADTVLADAIDHGTSSHGVNGQPMIGMQIAEIEDKIQELQLQEKELFKRAKNTSFEVKSLRHASKILQEQRRMELKASFRKRAHSEPKVLASGAFTRRRFSTPAILTSFQRRPPQLSSTISAPSAPTQDSHSIARRGWFTRIFMRRRTRDREVW